MDAQKLNSLIVRFRWPPFRSVLDISMDELQRNFDAEASDAIKHRSCYARNLLEYCCFRAIALSIQMAAHLADKNFRRLTFDMMLAWEAPSAASQPEVKVRLPSPCDTSLSAS